MFSDSRAPVPGEQKGFKPHAPHFIPWLRNSLKPHHSSDLGLNKPHKSSSEGRNNLTPLDRAKGIGFFSIQGKDRAKKGELKCNGVGMARMLPVVLRGHHILPGSLGKQREDCPARWNQAPELHPDGNTQGSAGDELQGLSNSSTSGQDNQTIVANHSSHLSLPQSNDSTSNSVRTYGPLVGPTPAPVPVLLTEEPNCKVPAGVGVEDRSGKVWDYSSSTIYRQRDLHSSSWLSADTQGPTERQHGFRSINQQSGNSQSQRDLTGLREPPAEGFNEPLNGVIFSTEVPQRGPSCTTTLRGPRKPRPSSERIPTSGQNQIWVQYRPTSERQPQMKGATCTRRVVRNQIKRVVDNLEQVLTALRDVHQEMKEVVQQIDHLTSSIDLNEEEEQRTEGGDSAKPPSDNSSSSGSSSSEVTVGSTHPRPSEDQPGTTDSSGTLSRNYHSRSQSPPNVPLCPVITGFSSERSRTLRFTCSLGSSTRPDGPLQYNNNLPSSNRSQSKNLTSHDLTLSPQRSLPVRPPTPGLSPLTVNLHHPNNPASQPNSPGPSSSPGVSSISPPSPQSSKPQPPPTLSPSVIIENKIGSYQTLQSDHPSAGPLSPSSTQRLSASWPPADSETQAGSNADSERPASSLGTTHRSSQVCTAAAATAKPATAQGRRGRKPPPYPHHRPSEHTKKVKEPRRAPPYPEKRKLLSTTV